MYTMRAATCILLLLLLLSNTHAFIKVEFAIMSDAPSDAPEPVGDISVSSFNFQALLRNLTNAVIVNHQQLTFLNASLYADCTRGYFHSSVSPFPVCSICNCSRQRLLAPGGGGMVFTPLLP
jgi:hypothetical protein